MLNLSDKRQHFRFPAYDDEVGVKLVNNKRRDFLKDVLDDGFVYKKPESYFPRGENKKDNIKTLNIDPVDMVDAPDYFGYNENSEREEVEGIERSRTAAFHQKEVIIEKNAKTLTNNNTYVEPTNVHYTAPQSSFSNKLFETDANGNAKYNKVDRRGSRFESSYDLPGAKGKSMFKPKHIPASLIEDEDEKPRHSREVIVNELRKASSGNLLLLEDEVILDPVAEPIDVTSAESPTVMPEKKKNQRLEKTLTGIIEDESNPKLDSYYFD